MLRETAKIVIREQLKQENQRKLFEKLLFTTIRHGGCFDRFVQVFITVSMVLFRCFAGFVSVFRVLVHAGMGRGDGRRKGGKRHLNEGGKQDRNSEKKAFVIFYCY